jgi:molybdopterin synthase sulfur carrier subunit
MSLPPAMVPAPDSTAPFVSAGPVVTVTFWAGAQRAAGHRSEQVPAGTLAQIRAALSQRPALASVMAVASLLVDGERFADDAALPAGATVDVLPPFAGGAR